MTEPMELVGVIRRSLHKNGMILSVVPVEQLLADAADTIEKLCNLPRDKQEAVKALRARVEELEQDLIDARSGWESAVELNRELDARTEELKKALANLYAQVDQAREGFGLYADSPSMSLAMLEAGKLIFLKSPEVTK